MLPSLLAREIQKGLKQFLITAYEPSDPFFSGIMERFTQDESRWMKGPYLQLGLPFRAGAAGKNYFDGFETEHPSFVHQETAWNRLASNRVAQSTIVATGTGSGKTECFLYPVLDHCMRAKASGHGGVKALVIYPMNALATDQAARFAKRVALTPAFKGLRVGLYVGGMAGKDGRGEVRMTAEKVITDRETLRRDPPDILLTNYKMLDYLLIRPKDSKLWAKNTPEMLRYIIVDELHTFDGAQGTDLALLLRRLKARLGTPQGHAICVGTSATLGGASYTEPIRQYAKKIFSLDFPADSVVIEDRLTEAEFLGNSPIEHIFSGAGELAELLRSEKYASPKEVVKAWFHLFFPEAEVPADVEDRAWRIALGQMLKRHLLFSNLIKILKGGIVPLGDLAQQMQGPLPESARAHSDALLDALLVLVAWARKEDGLPFVTLKVHLWLREMRRMVTEVSKDKEKIELLADSDLKRDDGKLYLPAIQCTACHATGWLSRLPLDHTSGKAKVSTELNAIYEAWFAGNPDALRLYPSVDVPLPLCDGYEQFLCTHCGALLGKDGDCAHCGSHLSIKVFQVTALRHGKSRAGTAYTRHDQTCPVCGSHSSPVLLGSRATTLGSVAIEQSWASTFNDDKKLIAFSDSVQDAAHRAGFFGARTYQNTVRTGISKVIDLFDGPQIPWLEFLERCRNIWLEEDSPLVMPLERFVSEFIGPNMTWQRDWAKGLLKDGVLKSSSKLPGRVQKRLEWQAFAEFTYLSRRGRSLDILGKATLAPSLTSVQTAADTLLPILHENFGIRHVTQKEVLHWLWGIVTRMRRIGAIAQPDLQKYAEKGDFYAFSNSAGRREWLPNIGTHAPRPLFLSLEKAEGCENIVGSGSQSFFPVWLKQAIGGLLPPGADREIYSAGLNALLKADIVTKIIGEKDRSSFGLNPDALYLETHVVKLATESGIRQLTTPKETANAFLDMPCLDAPQERYAKIQQSESWLADRFSRGDLRRVFSAEHTGLLKREQRESLELRFKDSKDPKPWYENLLSATPTLEMGVDIGDLSSVMLCSVPPNQSSYLQRSGRAGRRDGNAFALTIADGNNPHDLYFFDDTNEMLKGEVVPPDVFLKAVEVLRRQLFAFSMDCWVASGISEDALPKETRKALDALDSNDKKRFPYTFSDYVLAHDEEILKRFCDLLQPDLDERVELRLRDFMFGTDEKDGLRIRLQKILEELAAERKSHREKAEQIKKLIAEKKKGPQDQSTREEIAQLDRERQNKIELVKEINDRDLLNTLTDAGLIPNYAFPESGVELKSILWRNKGADDPQDGSKYITLPAERYERPAKSALSEFAPENHFFANQHEVVIEQVNMDLSKLEKWRLCPTCQHMQNLQDEADSYSSCPNCGEAMWVNLSQERFLLRFKQAIAHNNDVDSRIDDRAEDREPKFFVRQMLLDFDSKDVKEAYKLKASEVPFGFEFIQHVTFRDINFGEIDKGDDVYSVAGEKKPRSGFKLCRHCGQVQRTKRNEWERQYDQLHAKDCKQYGNDDPANIVECLYLYREFASEALRILMPYTSAGVEETSVVSFMAALRLGVQERFGGDVSHVGSIAQKEKIPGGTDRHCVVLYDSVPGGTGYLHELLADNAQALKDVIRLAYNKLSSCVCNGDPEKDGCYRCVYQYRMGRELKLISRDRARTIIKDILDSLDQLESIPTIKDIEINPNFDSELEAQFIEGLQRLSGKDGLPRIKRVQEIIGGKAGYILEVGEYRYRVEPQVDLGKDDGVAYSSRPDFVLWPDQKESVHRKPVAVFCDGWTFHRDSANEDARKRSALVSSGKFLVWSVTWEDVQASIEGSTTGKLTISEHLAPMCFNAPDILPPVLRAAYRESFWSQHSVAVLLGLLADPDSTGRLSRHAGATAFRMVPNHGTPEGATAREKLAGFWNTPELPEVDRPDGTACGNTNSDSVSLRYWWPKALTNAQAVIPLSLGLVIYDDAAEEADPQKHRAWQRWLWLFNIFQTLPGVLLATQTGIRNGDYATLNFSVPGKQAPDTHGAAKSAAWEAIWDQVIESLRDGLGSLIQTGAEPPDKVGFELDEDGDVVAEAELAWSGTEVVLLMPQQADYVTIWHSHGWKTVIADGDWAEEIGKAISSGKKHPMDGEVQQ